MTSNLNKDKRILEKTLDETERRVEEVKEKFDITSRLRVLTGKTGNVVSMIAIAWSIFHLYTAVFGSFEAMIQRAVHLAFALVLVFLLYPGSKESKEGKIPFIDVLLALFAIYPSYYMITNFRELTMRAGYVTTADFLTGILLILLVFEACRRAVGKALAVVAGSCLAYAYFGNYIPGYFGHGGFSVQRIVSHMYLTTEGIFGVPLGVSASYIFLFILFGTFLFKTGVGQLFIDLSMGLAGHQAGGPAKVAVISSGLLGTINGSTVANVVGTGSFTIPLMKSIGYKKEFAGAVEAAASTGGQLMPPIMGAAAFVMAEFTGIPYLRIAVAAAIPSILFYLSVLWQVHLEAKKLGLKGLPREELPLVSNLLKKKGHLLIPIIVILIILMNGYTPTYAAFFGIISTIVASSLHINTRMSLKTFFKALDEGARGATSIAIACAVTGFIIGTATLTGFGIKVAGGIVQLGGGNLILTLVLTMLASLILGMGLPTTANYIVTATMAAPALLTLGVGVLPAHLFVFYFGIISDLTPPVALGAMAAAGISGGDPFKTGIQASKLAIVSYIVPFFFVLSPQLLCIDSSIFNVIWTFCTAILGVILVAISIEGFFLSHLNFLARLIIFPAGLVLLYPGLISDIIGGSVFAFLYILQKKKLSKVTKVNFIN